MRLTEMLQKLKLTSPFSTKRMQKYLVISHLPERVIRHKIVSHLEANDLLSRNQHGFRKVQSCLTHLLKHIDDIIQSILNGIEHDVIYLDFAKAFDKDDHEILLQKL